MAKQKQAPQTAELINPKLANNAKLDLDRFDYNKLEGKMYEELYNYLFGEVINPDELPNKRIRRGGAMVDVQKYVFEAYVCTPIRRRVYPDMPNSPWKIAGLKLEKEKPTHETSTFWRNVKDVFTQLEPNFSNNAPTVIYLPKKVKYVSNTSAVAEESDEQA
jgi:hypothetical protein